MFLYQLYSQAILKIFLLKIISKKRLIIKKQQQQQQQLLSRISPMHSHCIFEVKNSSIFTIIKYFLTLVCFRF